MFTCRRRPCGGRVSPGLAAQSAGAGGLSVIQAGVGVGAGTGRFGGPGLAVIVSLVPQTRPVALGVEMAAVVHVGHSTRATGILGATLGAF